MAQQSGLLAPTAGRIWKASGLKPHLSDTFKPSADSVLPAVLRTPEVRGSVASRKDVVFAYATP
jgi:hypothetical protein